MLDIRRVAKICISRELMLDKGVENLCLVDCFVLDANYRLNFDGIELTIFHKDLPITLKGAEPPVCRVVAAEALYMYSHLDGQPIRITESFPLESEESGVDRRS